ncbi:MAG: hypothetical protein AAB785_00045 [Patescibacteria group bacterium]
MTIKGLSAKLIAKNGKRAEIEIEGQKILIPEEFIPASLKIGENLKLFLLDSESGIIQEKKLAKMILEEILNGK